MLIEEMESLECVRAAEPMLSTLDVAGEDRTLIYGYSLDRDTVHVYLQGGELHYVVYSADRKLVCYEKGTQLEAQMVRPSKRAYPARTDYKAAEALAAKGVALTFTAYREEEIGAFGPSEKFYGFTIEELPQAEREYAEKIAAFHAKHNIVAQQ